MIIILAIITLVIGIVFLIIGLRLKRTNVILKRVVDRQSALIKTQREVLEMKDSTIKNYKSLLAKGISIVTNEQQN